MGPPRPSNRRLRPAIQGHSATRERKLNARVQRRSNRQGETLRSAGSGIALERPETSGKDSKNVKANAVPIFHPAIVTTPVMLVATEAYRTGVLVTGSRRDKEENDSLPTAVVCIGKNPALTPACTGAYFLSTLPSVAKLLAGASSRLLRASACNRVAHAEKLHSRRCLLLSSSKNFLNFQTIRVAR